MTGYQAEKILELKDILSLRRNRKNEVTFLALEDKGFKIKWMRVRWCGGVGSWKMMRSRRVRMQVAAARSGYERAKMVAISSSDFAVTFGYKKVAAKKIGYKYAYCVEF